MASFSTDLACDSQLINDGNLCDTLVMKMVGPIKKVSIQIPLTLYKFQCIFKVPKKDKS